MTEHLYPEIRKAYIDCEEEVSGEKSEHVEVSMIGNHLVFLEKKPLAPANRASACFIRGRNIGQAMQTWKQQHFQAQLKQKLSALIGCPVRLVQSDIVIDAEERMSIVHFDGDL